jgi:Dolichyl-phosphate-mannose-protein mannosyltransferase
MNPDRSQWRWFFMLAALEAGAAFFALAWVPRTGSGFSVLRITLLASLFVFFIGGIYFTVRLPHRLVKPLQPGYALVSALFSLTLAIVLFLLRYFDPGRFLIYYQRISPLLFYLFILTAQFSLFVLAFHYGIHFDNNSLRRKIYLPTLVAFVLLILVFLFIALTRIGLIPDNAYWGEPGIPLMGWQFGLAILGGTCILLAGLRVRSSSRLDVIVPLALWILAVVIWLRVPISVMQNSFYAPMNPPTNQPFPNSDAGYYDSMAQSLLMGYQYLGDIPTRPLYVVLLAFLHWLAGDRYELIIAGQTLLLALIPVILYFLGMKLHSRMAGVVIALFAIFRELTSLLISSQTRVSNTKTLLVDLPTLLLLLVACLFALRWLERKDSRSGILAGGMFGLLLLLRTQSMVILPFLFVIVILAFGLRNRGWILALVFFLAGFAVTIAPWLLHNYLKSGQLTFDAPFEYQVVASQYQYTGNLNLQSVDLQGKSLFGILLTFAIRDPKFVLGFIATHFLATQINGLLALPLIEPYNGLFAPLNLYWMSWNGSLSWYNAALVIIYLAIIAVGLGAIWKRLRWIGLLPLAFSLGYSLANGLGRFSGWRYDLPADWISYFYFGIGVAEIIGAAALIFGAKSEMIFTSFSNYRLPETKWNHGFLITGVITSVFVLIGALPWLAQGLAVPRYSDLTLTKLVTTLSDSSSVQQLGVDRKQIEMFSAAPQTTLQIGRVLYPRFFTRNQGLASSHPWPAFAPRDFPRLGFELLNQSRKDALLPSRTIPDPFPSASDAIVLGCQRTDYIEVRLILFPNSDTAYLSTPLTVPCN